MPGLDMKEVEKLRTDVETAKRHALKMENEKMAAERSIQREMEDIKSRLSDANDELQYLRALDGQTVQQELQNAKKDAQKERLALEQELESRSDDLEKRKMDVLRLETRLSEVQDEVDQLRSEASVAVQPDEDEVRGLQESIANLKQELEKRTTAYHEAMKQIEILEDKLKAASKPVSDSAPTNAQAAKLQRAHQREIEDLQQAKDTLRRHLADSEELVAERDAEIFELKRHMPLPSSSADASFHELSVVDTEELKQQLTAKAEQLEEAHQAKALLEDRLQCVETELTQALATASSKGVEHDKLREQLESTLSETEQKRHVRRDQSL
jgi:chromosome segregation ATPase